MKYSFIVPVYNVAEYIEDSVHSILKQNYGDFEVILVDDGSTDGSGDLCRRYSQADSRVKCINKKNEGVTIARQTGVEAASGKYLIFVDGDDRVSENLLAEVDSVLSQQDFDIICFGYNIFYNDSESTVPFPLPEGCYDAEAIRQKVFPDLIQNRRAGYFPPSVWGKVFVREKYKLTQLTDTNANVAEDFACTAPYIFASRSMYIIDKPLYEYRQRGTSLTKGRTVFRWDVPEIVLKHVEKHIDMSLYDFKEQLDRRNVHDVFNVAVSRFYQDKPYSEIRKEIITNLNRDYYNSAIEACSFDGLRSKLMAFAMKRRCCALMWLYSKLK